MKASQIQGVAVSEDSTLAEKVPPKSRARAVRRPEERRQAVMEAALRLLPIYGLSGTTIKRLAKAGMSEGGLYRSFAGRVELMNGVASVPARPAGDGAAESEE